MDLNKLYFYTTTVNYWIPIFQNEKLKNIILDSFKHLTTKGKIKIYGFVIMPNHIHLIWEAIEMNGNELPQNSFKKYTSHKILEYLKNAKAKVLERFIVEANDRNYNLWKEKPVATEIYSPNVIYQKLDYIHHNPVKGKWRLAESPIDYKYSSARFYEDGVDEFGFMNHIGKKI